MCFFIQSKEWTPNNVNHLLMMTLRANGIRIKDEIMEKLQDAGILKYEMGFNKLIIKIKVSNIYENKLFFSL